MEPAFCSRSEQPSQSVDIPSHLDGRYHALNIAFQDIKSKYLKQKEIGFQPTCKLSMTRPTLPCECLSLQHRITGLQKQLLVKSNNYRELEMSLADVKIKRDNLELENDKLKRANIVLVEENEILRSNSLRPTKEDDVFEEESNGILQEIQAHESPVTSKDNWSMNSNGGRCCRCSSELSSPVNELYDSTSSLPSIHKQINSLTMEKKQLMTNVHWLNNEIWKKDEDIRQLQGAVSTCCCQSKHERHQNLRSLSSCSDPGSLEEGKSLFLPDTRRMRMSQTHVAEKLQLVASQLVTLKRHLAEGQIGAKALQELIAKRKNRTGISTISPENMLCSHRASLDRSRLDIISTKLDLTTSSFLEYKEQKMAKANELGVLEHYLLNPPV